MAQYRLSAKVYNNAISKRIDYINREGKYKYGTKSEDFLIGWSGNLPSWAANERDFWRTIEKLEKPGQVQARGFQLNLPVELPMKEQVKITKQFMDECFKNHAYTLVIHNKAGNPHVHVYVCERLIDDRPEPDRNSYCKQRTGYSKDRSMTGAKRNQWLRKTRKTWEVIQNNALERCGSKERVSCETLEKQKAKRLPLVHLGPIAAALERRGVKTRRGDINRRIQAVNKRLAAYLQEISNMHNEIAEIDTNILAEKKKVHDLEVDNSKIKKELEKQRIEKEKHQNNVWRFCRYFISKKDGIDELCNHFDKKDYAGFVSLLVDSFHKEKNQHNAQFTSFGKELSHIEREHNFKLTSNEISKCLTYKFWSLYSAKKKEDWSKKYESYITYLDFRRATAKILNNRPKTEKELRAYEKDLKKWDGISNTFTPNGQNPFGEDVNFHVIIGNRIKEINQAIQNIEVEKDSVLSFEKRFKQWTEQPAATREDIAKHMALSEELAKQKEVVVHCVRQLKNVSREFALEHEKWIESLDKKIELDAKRVADELERIKIEERKQQEQKKAEQEALNKRLELARQAARRIDKENSSTKQKNNDNARNREKPLTPEVVAPQNIIDQSIPKKDDVSKHIDRHEPLQAQKLPRTDIKEMHPGSFLGRKFMLHIKWGNGESSVVDSKNFTQFWSNHWEDVEKYNANAKHPITKEYLEKRAAEFKNDREKNKGRKGGRGDE